MGLAVGGPVRLVRPVEQQPKLVAVGGGALELGADLQLRALRLGLGLPLGARLLARRLLPEALELGLGQPELLAHAVELVLRRLGRG